MSNVKRPPEGGRATFKEVFSLEPDTNTHAAVHVVHA